MSAVFAQANDFRNWAAWSPWATLDPPAQTTVAGGAAGHGAVFRWSGNEAIGAGTMTITESRRNERISIRIDFLKPLVGSNVADFAFEAHGSLTEVTWSMSGSNDLMAKAVFLCMNADRQIGSRMQEGLARMKAHAERMSAETWLQTTTNEANGQVR